MKNKHNSFFHNSINKHSSLFKYPPSFKSNQKLVKTKYNSPDRDIESSIINQKYAKNNNNKGQKHQFSYFNFLSPIFNLNKKNEKFNKNQTTKNNLILTSFNNISGINIPKKEEKILPYEYNHNNNSKGKNSNKKYSKKPMKKNKIYYMNNISLANFLSINKNSKIKSSKKKKKDHKTPDNNIISKLNSEKRNNQRKKNYFLTSLRSKKIVLEEKVKKIKKMIMS